MKRLFKFYLLIFFIFFSFKTIPNDEDILAYKNKITLHYEALYQSGNVMSYKTILPSGKIDMNV